MPLGISEVSHPCCNVIQGVWLDIRIQDNFGFLVFIILGCGPVDYNPSLKGCTFFQSHYSCGSKWIYGMYADLSETVWGAETLKVFLKRRKTLLHKRLLTYSTQQS